MDGITPEVWQATRDLFEACLEKGPKARESLLAKRAIEAPEMVAMVRGMLAADERTCSPVEMVADLAKSVVPQVEDDGDGLIGLDVGVFRIKRRLGEGGMSTVYLAERSDGKFQQQVAIKVLRKGMDSEGILARFQNEQHILARLEHPHIARLLEADDLPDGRPCFILEYVKGEPIDNYCDRMRLSLAERISLFRDVCEAVAFAHGCLVLHRDIKPSNILVDEHDQVKLLDFGIAKVLEPGRHEVPLHTRTGFRMLTPEYASPEQLKGLPLTTASDIYGLGVMLFQLLTGRRPTQNRATPTLTTRTLTTKPSEVFGGKTGPLDLAAVCQVRKTTVPKARRLLKGDLDTITAVALHQEPERRYGGARQLRDDLDRFLVGKPIDARGDSLGYTLSKFVGRHKLAVALGVFALISLIAGLSISLVQYRVAVGQRDLARKETQRAERLVGLLTNVFRSSSPRQSKGENISAKDVLDRGAATMFKRLDGDLETQLRLSNAIAVVYRNLGEMEKAESLLEDGLKQATAAWGENHVLVANTARTLGSLRSWQGDYPESEMLYNRAIRIHQGLDEPRELARDLGELSTVFLSNGKYAEAEKVIVRAIAIHQQLSPPDNERWLSALSNRAVLNYFQKKYDAAGKAYLELLALQKAHYGEVHFTVATTLHNLGSLRQKQNQFEESVTLLREALAMKQAVYGVDNSHASVTLRNLGKAYQRLRRYPEAVAVMQRAVTGYSQYIGADHHSTYQARVDLANALVYAGEHEKAEPHYRQGLVGLLDKRGPKHGLTAYARLYHSRFLLSQGAVADALPMAKAAYDYYKGKSSSTINQGVAQAVYGTALFLTSPGSKEGLTLWQKGQATLAAQPPSSDPDLEIADQLNQAFGILDKTTE